MTEKQMKSIVEHQVLLTLNERELSFQDIGRKQYMQELYDMAIKMLVEVYNEDR